MKRHDPGKRGAFVMGQNTRPRKQPLVPFSIASQKGLTLGDEFGLMDCGCKVYIVKTEGLALPLNTAVVGMHSVSYGCKHAPVENMIEPQPKYRR